MSARRLESRQDFGIAPPAETEFMSRPDPAVTNACAVPVGRRDPRRAVQSSPARPGPSPPSSATPQPSGAGRHSVDIVAQRTRVAHRRARRYVVGHLKLFPRLHRGAGPSCGHEPRADQNPHLIYPRPGVVPGEGGRPRDAARRPTSVKASRWATRSAVATCAPTRSTAEPSWRSRCT